MDVPIAVQTLARHIEEHPLAGIRRHAAVSWPAPRLHPTNADVVIVEDHGGFAYGGNKVRHLDLILGLALAKGADVALTAAGSHSNLCRVLAAACRYLGIDVHLVQRGTPSSRPTGNQILSSLAGAAVDRIPVSDPFSPAQDELVERIAEDYRKAGRNPFVIDVRDAHAPLSALAETALLSEVDLPWIPNTVVVASGAGSTAAGLLLSIAARGWDTQLLAVSTNVHAGTLRGRILSIAERTAIRAGLEPGALGLDQRLFVTDAFVGGGHGVPTAAAAAAAARTGRTTGIFLDATYTGKAMAALLDSPSTGRTCFVHTGGGPTVFQEYETQPLGQG